MGKVISDSIGKVWENRTGQKRTKQYIPRSSVSYMFCEKLKSIQFPKLKTWEKWISVVQEKYGKTQTFQIYGFLKYFW